MDEPAKARHAAVAVKVPDNRVEHPQRGIDRADIVFVELEGYRDSAGHSGTRLMPVYHSQLPETVEPPSGRSTSRCSARRTRHPVALLMLLGEAFFVPSWA